MMSLYVLLASPLLAGLLTGLLARVAGRPRLVDAISVAGALMTCVAGLLVVGEVVSGGPRHAPQGPLTVDAPSALLGASGATLSWTELRAIAAGLDPDLMRLAFVFVVIGFGAKAGFAPLHTWLPDAHSQAPSPVSGLLSGVLLNCALYGILRFLPI